MKNAISLLMLAVAVLVGINYGFWHGLVAFLVLAAARSAIEGGGE